MFDNKIKQNRGMRLCSPMAPVILLAVLFAALRHGFQTDQYVSLLAHYFLEDTALGSTPLVWAALHGAYTWAPKAMAGMIAWMSGATGAPVHWCVFGLLLALWAFQAYWTYRLGRAVTGSVLSAAIAVLIFGFDVPVFLSETAYSLQFLERSLGMAPLLWGLARLAEGKPWIAWTGAIIALYAHPSPAMFFIPVLVLEEFIAFKTHPKNRTGAALRMACVVCAALPLLAAVIGHKTAGDYAAWERMNVTVNFPNISGMGLAPADHVFRIESLVVLAASAWATRNIPGRWFLIRVAAVGVGFAAWGSATYYELGMPWGSLPWVAATRMVPWLGLGLLDLAATLLLGCWMGRLMLQGEPSALFLIYCLSLSFTHDIVLRGFAALTSLCLALCFGRAAFGVAALSIIPGSLHILFPGLLRQWAAGLGWKGGFLSSIGFLPLGVASVAGCLAAGWGLQRLKERRRAPACMVAAWAILLGSAVFRYRGATMAEGSDFRPMAEWIRGNLPKESIVYPSPINLVDCADFMRASRRDLFACGSYAHALTLWGAWGVPMIRRLEAAGLRPRNVRDWKGFLEEVSRLDLSLSPEGAHALARRYGVTHLLLRSDRPWWWTPVRTEGDLALYPIPAGDSEPLQTSDESPR